MPRQSNGPNADLAAAMASPTAKSYKRKRKAGEERWYAVRAGKVPGVYSTWAECQANTAGFAGAVYKAFPTRHEAELFAAGKNPNPGSTPNRYYAVAIGKHPGIYTEWADAQAAYTGVKAPKYKRFDTREEAEAWMQSFAHRDISFTFDDAQDDEDLGAPLGKKVKSEIQFTLGGLENIGLQEIYTDGSTLSNGQDGAVAGVGVFFGDGDPRNISERLAGEVQTNQRAELTAILRALQLVPITQGVLIWSDSTYAIKCVTEWFAKWEANGWKTHKGPVQNRDLVELVLQEIRKRDAVGTKTRIQWIKGHEGNRGNVEADGLAVKGANDAKASSAETRRRRR